ncbi:hypothetical protein ABWL48_06885 [Streptococcus suis]
MTEKNSTTLPYVRHEEEAWEEAREETEQKERLEFAQRLLADGLDNDTIARYTTLPLSLVEQLRSQLVAGF